MQIAESAVEGSKLVDVTQAEGTVASFCFF
jgi:hypothetical protein